MAEQASLELALAQLAGRAWRPVPVAEPIPLDALPTPALLIDEAAFERNLLRMATFLGACGKGVRPHAKTHKCPIIAARQLAAGAVGICVAKVSEAAVMIGAGIDRVLITSPLTDPAKVRLAADLARRARVDLVVDSEHGLALARAAATPTASLGVLVDVDVAMGRTGTRELDRVLALAEGVAAAPGLEFRGVQHYAGHLMHLDGHARRRDESLRLWQRIGEIVAALNAAGLPPAIVTGGGTGTYDIDCDVPQITDLQVGSYIFMDQQYRLVGGRGGDCFDDFEVALQVATTVISQPLAGAVTLDGGYKAFASDTVAPVRLDSAGSVAGGAEFRFAGDEHGVLIGGEAGIPAGLGLGSRHRFIAPHCDPTVNLYDYYWVCNDGFVTALWPIAARGCSW